jgi:hypothetical protein
MITREWSATGNFGQPVVKGVEVCNRQHIQIFNYTFLHIAYSFSRSWLSLSYSEYFHSVHETWRTIAMSRGELYWMLPRTILRCIVPFVGNDSVNTFPRRRERETIGCPLLGNVSVNKLSKQYRACFLRGKCREFVGNKACRLSYLFSRIRSSSGVAIEGVWEEMARKELDWKEDFICNLKLQGDLYPLSGYD